MGFAVAINPPSLPHITEMDNTLVRISVPIEDEYNSVQLDYAFVLKVTGTYLLSYFISNRYNGTFLFIRIKMNHL